MPTLLNELKSVKLKPAKPLNVARTPGVLPPDGKKACLDDSKAETENFASKPGPAKVETEQETAKADLIPLNVALILAVNLRHPYCDCGSDCISDHH